MDIDLSALPREAAVALLQRKEDVRVLHAGKPVARVVPDREPAFQSLRAFRDRLRPMAVPSEDLLRAEREER